MKVVFNQTHNFMGRTYTKGQIKNIDQIWACYLISKNICKPLKREDYDKTLIRKG